MENLEQEEIEQNQIQDRPTGLVILLILSGIANFFGLITNIVTWLVTTGNLVPREELEEKMMSVANAMGGGGNQEAMEEFMHSFIGFGPSLSAVGFFACMGSLVAVFFMLRYKRIGFHLYVASRILEVAMPPLIAGTMFFNVFGLLSSVIFVYLYSRFLKLLNK